MKPKDESRYNVEEIIDSFSGVKRAEANPFIFTRIQARLEKLRNQPATEKIERFITRPAVATLIIILVLVINIMVLSSKSGTTTSDQIQVTPTDEYNLAVNTLYDYENQEQ